MAINPLISLQARAPDIGQTFSNALLNIGRIDQLKQARETRQRQEEISDVLGKIGQPEQLPPGQAGPIQILSQDELIQQAKQIDPVLAENQLKAIGLDNAEKRAEASRFAVEVQSLPLEQQNQRIAQRAESLRSQGRNPADTLQLLQMNPQERTQALQGVQLLDLSTAQRLTLQQKRAQAAKSAEGFKDTRMVDGKLFGIKGGVLQEIPATGGASIALQEQEAVKQEAKEAKELADRQATTFTQTQSLRKEFEAKTKPQQQSLDAFRSFQSLQRADESLINEFKKNLNAFADPGVDKNKILADAQAISDVALIFSFFKTVDPTSTVREGEFATIENAGGVQTRFTNLYNRLLEGGRLNEAQRGQIVRIAENKSKTAQKEINRQEKKFKFTAKKQNIDPELVIVPEEVSQQTPGVVRFDRSGQRIQ